MYNTIVNVIIIVMKRLEDFDCDVRWFSLFETFFEKFSDYIQNIHVNTCSVYQYLSLLNFVIKFNTVLNVIILVMKRSEDFHWEVR